jgi:hypothetical protein
VINLFLFPYCAEVAVLPQKISCNCNHKDRMQLQPVEAYWAVQYQKVPRSGTKDPMKLQPVEAYLAVRYQKVP